MGITVCLAACIETVSNMLVWLCAKLTTPLASSRDRCFSDVEASEFGREPQAWRVNLFMNLQYAAKG